MSFVTLLRKAALAATGLSLLCAPVHADAAPERTMLANPSSALKDFELTNQAGKPVRLNVTRDEKPTCGDVLTIPSQNISKPIPVNQVTTIEFTPQQAGDLEFTCGMNMMKGKIVVQ